MNKTLRIGGFGVMGLLATAGDPAAEIKLTSPSLRKSWSEMIFEKMSDIVARLTS